MVEVRSKRAAGLIGIGVGAVLGLIIGLLIGYGSGGGDDTEQNSKLASYLQNRWIEDGGEGKYYAKNTDGRSIDELLAMVSTDNIKENLKELTKEPHLAGTERDEELADFIRDRMNLAGMDNVDMSAMDVLLSRPDPNNPNLIRIYDGSDNIQFTSNYKEKPLHADDESPTFVHAFNAYTPAGDIYSARGEGVVYVNYGRIEDFERLRELGLNISGKIAMMRYGKIYRGNKVQHAAQFGAIGAILFSDPEDVARAGQGEKDVYPYSTWLPGTGMQRGNSFVGQGDPLTPGWPSVRDAYRLPKEKAGLPTIPTQPIGYADAKEILRRLGGPEAPADWQGTIEGITYKMGPEFMPEFSDYRLRLTSNNYEEVVKSYNVIGMFEGDVEPDRYVLIGNHRDAWGYGASDPSSGTAQLLETMRIFGDLKKNGWKPRRTLVFCSWGAEEYGLIGSKEWVEAHIDKLERRAVTYINTDTCASGKYVQMKSSPLLFDVLTKIADMVPGVMDPSKTILREWEEHDRMKNVSVRSYPILKTLGSGSDYAHFTFYAGIPSMDIWFRKEQAERSGLYPTYHTGYDTFFGLVNNTDPGFKSIQACGRLSLLFLKYLSESVIIPFNLHNFADIMKETLYKYGKDGTSDKLKQIYPKYDKLKDAALLLTLSTKRFSGRIADTPNSKDPFKIRRINDIIMQFEQEFILPQGLPGRPLTRHAIFSPSKFDNYAASAFPGISDLLHGYEELRGEEKEEREEQIRRHISDLTIMTQRAIHLVEYFYDIKEMNIGE